MIIPLITALQKIDSSLLKASGNLGASRSRTFLRVDTADVPARPGGGQPTGVRWRSQRLCDAGADGIDQIQLIAPAIYYEAITNSSWALAGAMATLVLGIVALVLILANVYAQAPGAVGADAYDPIRPFTNATVRRFASTALWWWCSCCFRSSLRRWSRSMAEIGPISRP